MIVSLVVMITIMLVITVDPRRLVLVVALAGRRSGGIVRTATRGLSTGA
jgi:hypothetical protein